jgi:hypothetical protein
MRIGVHQKTGSGIHGRNARHIRTTWPVNTMTERAGEM